jgi:hypothetical protein
MTNGKCHGVKHYIVRNPDDKDDQPFTFSLRFGRERDVLDALISAGTTGCSFSDFPAPRWASSIFRLRRRDINIHTEMEPHSGNYPGFHARYRLLSEVICVGENGDGADRA